MNSQTARILAYLKTGATLTPIEALDRFGCFRLSGRIYDLKKLGHQIETTLVENDGRRFARYRLA